MRLTMPEPKITLYKDGFDQHCVLNRKETGQKLSELVERIDEPLVIALDGAWGSGKSFFLKCWVGEHLKRDDNTTETIYFDAFKHDFLDEPLIALTAAIAERIEREPESKAAKTWKAAKNAAPFLAKAAFRLGTMAVVGTAVSWTSDEDGAVNDIGDALAKEGGDIAKSLTQFWKQEDGKRAAMEAFKEALIELTDPDEEGSPTRKLVIVIDELDRCRPDYALSLLEITKHFFAVDGVHFILGANLGELQNSVRARYGEGINSAKYLQKFVSIVLPFGVSKTNIGNMSDYSKYFEYVCKKIGLIENWIYSYLRDYVLMTNHHFRVGLRDVEKIASLASATPQTGLVSDADHHLLAVSIVLKVLAPELLETARFEPVDFQKFDDIFLLRSRKGERGFFQTVFLILHEVSNEAGVSLSESETERAESLFRKNGQRTGGERVQAFRNIIARNLDTFSLVVDL